MAIGLMTAVTIRSDHARLAMKILPASLSTVSVRLRRFRRCFIATVVMTTKLPTVPTTAAKPSTATYGPATTGRRLYRDSPRPTADAEDELFISFITVSGNSMTFTFPPLLRVNHSRCVTRHLRASVFTSAVHTTRSRASTAASYTGWPKKVSHYH